MPLARGVVPPLEGDKAHPNGSRGHIPHEEEGDLLTDRWGPSVRWIERRKEICYSTHLQNPKYVKGDSPIENPKTVKEDSPIGG